MQTKKKMKTIIKIEILESDQSGRIVMNHRNREIAKGKISAISVHIPGKACMSPQIPMTQTLPDCIKVWMQSACYTEIVVDRTLVEIESRWVYW